MNVPLQVGITGGIGAGKSLVSRIFNCFGVPVYDADNRAKAIMTTDLLLVEQIKNEFGPASYHADGSLDRTFLGKSTFGNAERLAQLNSLVHPRVAIDYHQWAQEQKSSYILREAALLYEAGAYTSVDKMIVVTAPVNIRIRRVLDRDAHRSEQDVHAIINSQWPDEEKLKRADYIVYNDEQHMVIPQVIALHERFSILSEQRERVN